MNLMLHICCAICFSGTLEVLEKEGINVASIFYNPNIHPLLEFRRRLKALKVYEDFLNSRRQPSSGRLQAIDYLEDYGIYEFLLECLSGGPNGESKVVNREHRCARCYEMRLKLTAERGIQRGCEAFSTTLLVSPHQNHKLLRSVGAKVGEQVGIPFEYRDLRACYERSLDIAKRRMLYRQSYCGCIFSEYERYKDTTKHIWGH